MRAGAFNFREVTAANTVVRRAVGFNRAFEYVAETTVENTKGELVTVREGGHTADGAMSRAMLAARDRAGFAGLRRAIGFGRRGEFRAANSRATFALGFAT